MHLLSPDSMDSQALMAQCDILLPSNKEWRMKNYFKLVEQQRALDANPMPAVWPEKMEEGKCSAVTQPEAKRARRSSLSVESGLSVSSTLSVETTWTVSDIAKAGCLLATPPRSVAFEDEEEMRRVYSLIYDVFRYKSVLHQALVDVAFFTLYPQFKKDANLIWLLFYDLYKRRFLPRDHHDQQCRMQLFTDAGLLEAETHLWNLRVKLAAAVARLRIKNNALRLSQLLPPHLRDERVIALDEAPVTGWINTFKIDTSQVTSLLEKAGLTPLESIDERLDVLNYMHDDLCPKFIKCHPTQRSDLAQSTLVRRYHIILQFHIIYYNILYTNAIILQDRAFCLGPVIMCQILLDLDLSGIVVLTHINSPRTMAYFANILYDNPKIDSLLAFGAGDRKEEYQDYLRSLGVTNTVVHSERFVDIVPGSDMLENVVAVLATPPNTYSGVIDPVDLVCSRGGDLSMLEVLTATEIGGGSLERVNTIMEEQRQTLRLGMSKPHIQVVLYETHSIVPAENTEMVTRLVNEMNNFAREKHAEEQGKPLSPSYSSVSFKREGPEMSPGAGGESIISVEIVEKDSERAFSSEIDITNGVLMRSSPIKPPTTYSNIPRNVPPCDIFELHPLPVIYDKDVSLEKEGCYLAYLRRKEIVRLNAKYMINIAESRGLFGGEGGTKEGKKSASGRQRKKPELQRSTSASPPLLRPKGRRSKFEIERIAAPTHASILRRVTDPGKRASGDLQDAASSSSATSCCQRHQNHLQHETLSTIGVNPKVVAQIRRQDARRWWGEAARHVLTYGLNEEQSVQDQNQISESVKPLLKLTRSRPNGKVPFPISVRSIEFSERDCHSPILDLSIE
ncbi:putative methyltransferase NSUN7 [Periplaneta americana]|uniref:putative methyltransferase NSUN7 n=1 Tax=Periplaneta americana TaxID=6978 RepID=UPI0037E8120A